MVGGWDQGKGVVVWELGQLGLESVGMWWWGVGCGVGDELSECEWGVQGCMCGKVLAVEGALLDGKCGWNGGVGRLVG